MSDDLIEFCPTCGGDVDYPLVGEHQEQSPYLECKNCDWNERGVMT